MNTRTVTSLWVGGELPLMSVLCIKSFLDHGHAFQLFTYSQIWASRWRIISLVTSVLPFSPLKMAK